MSHDVQRMFDSDKARQYDTRIRKAIPAYDALHKLACIVVAEETCGQGHVLVVGAGTGAECVTLAQSCPHLRLTGADPAHDMVAYAVQKVADHNLSDRVSLHPTVVSDMPDQPPFDAATLFLVLHFLPDDGAKLALLNDIADRLAPGAPLILLDLFGPDWSDGWQSRLRVYWRHLQLAADIPADDVERGFRVVDRDIHPITESRLTDLLAEAGFGAPDAFARALCFGGWVARKL